MTAKKITRSTRRNVRLSRSLSRLFSFREARKRKRKIVPLDKLSIRQLVIREFIGYPIPLVLPPVPEKEPSLKKRRRVKPRRQHDVAECPNGESGAEGGPGAEGSSGLTHGEEWCEGVDAKVVEESLEEETGGECTEQNGTLTVEDVLELEQLLTSGHEHSLRRLRQQVGLEKMTPIELPYVSEHNKKISKVKQARELYRAWVLARQGKGS